MKFLLDFFTKKSRVQGRALPLAGEARVSKGQSPLAPPAEGNAFWRLAKAEARQKGEQKHGII
ncbi:hypothetical protein D3Z48_06315 [Clostridiaceae bacterium]|nr:hypothetical protein [Clostridiaceae bacterium]